MDRATGGSWAGLQRGQLGRATGGQLGRATGGQLGRVTGGAAGQGYRGDSWAGLQGDSWVGLQGGQLGRATGGSWAGLQGGSWAGLQGASQATRAPVEARKASCYHGREPDGYKLICINPMLSHAFPCYLPMLSMLPMLSRYY